jgi:hypothetical protein
MKISTELFSHLTRSLGEGIAREADAEERGSARIGVIGRGVIIPCPARCRRQPVSVAVRDLSSTGIGVMHSQRLEQGEKFILRVPAVPGQSAGTAVLCTVVHCRPVGLGVYLIGAHFASLIQPAAAADENRPVSLPTASIATAFRQQTADELSEEEAEQLRQLEARLNLLQSQ